MGNTSKKKLGLSLSSKLVYVITPLLVLLATNLGVMLYFLWDIKTALPTVHAAHLLESDLLNLHYELVEFHIGIGDRKEAEGLQEKVINYLYYLRGGNKVLGIRESPGRLDEPGYKNLWWNWDLLIRRYEETCQPLTLKILESPAGREREEFLFQHEVKTKALFLDVSRMATLMREHFLLGPFDTLLRISLGLFVASMIGTGVTFLLMRLFIRRPLRDLAGGMEEVAKGKWGKTVEVRTRDELGRVAQSFNYLSVGLEKTIQSLEKERLELEEANEKLQESCYRDVLTGLYNYYYFKETLETEYLLASRHATPLSLIMLDADHFKHINDTFSHQFGNFVLQEMGKRIKESLRRTDIAYRYGGEEFAILLPQTNYEGAKEVVRRIKDNLCGRTYQDGTSLCSIAVTMGISSLEEPEVKESADLMRLADEALLEGKSRGGNCVIFASETRKRPELDVSILEDYQRRLATSEKNLKRAYMDNTNALLRALEGKDNYSAVHTCLVAAYVWHFTGALNLPSEEREVIKNAALLYDLGKISIPDAILTKKGTLTSEEFALVKQHPYYSASIVKGIKFLEQEVPIILHHHERWDGHGYPDGLKGKDIPLGARVLALTDAYEALTSHRPYRNARPPEEAFKVLQEESGHQFDPELVEPFIKAMRGFISTTRRVYISQLDKVVDVGS